MDNTLSSSLSELQKFTEESEEGSFTIPEKSKSIYMNSYNAFNTWKLNKGINSSSEAVLLEYFHELSAKYKPTTLWTTYSMLKCTINLLENVNIMGYSKLLRFLKWKQEGFKPRTSSTFTPEQINQFMTEANDFRYLPTKVAVILGFVGACRCEEMYNMKLSDIEDLGTKYLVSVRVAKSKKMRRFILKDQYFEICKKYFAGRTAETNTHVFLQYRNGKVVRHRIGINAFVHMAKAVARFLKLENPTEYTGHSFRKSSAEITYRNNKGYYHDTMIMESLTTNNSTSSELPKVLKAISPEPPPLPLQPRVNNSINASSIPLQLLIMNESGEMIDVGKSGVTETFANNLAKTWAQKLLKLEPYQQLEIITQFNNNLNDQLTRITQPESSEDAASPFSNESVDTSYDINVDTLSNYNFKIEPTQITEPELNESKKFGTKR